MLAKPLIGTATIAASGSLSDAVEVGSGEVVGLSVPTITAAAITFQGSDDGTTYRDLYDASGTEVAIPSSTGARFFQAPAAVKGVAYLKVRSGTTGVPVAQSGGATIKVVIK